MSSHLGLFEGFGIELEYMIVERDTLRIAPCSDELMREAAGELVSDFQNGDITWSNELVLHVIELKTSRPATTLRGLESSFQANVRKINSILAGKGLCLMPSAMHPLMDPSREMKIWPHDNNEVYSLYDRIFDCRGHGWSNLQSMHINLPFKTDDEFRRLHTAIRFLLPILPALTASSPIVDGQVTGAMDSRLVHYQKNQRRVPSIAGDVIPEPVRSIEEYQKQILGRVYQDIAPHDPDEILREDWLNSRGAIARFGRQSIEIRVLDIQENPAADLALADLICTTVKELTAGRLVPFETQLAQPTRDLKAIMDQCIQSAEAASIGNTAYLSAWQTSSSSPSHVQRPSTNPSTRPGLSSQPSPSTGLSTVDSYVHSAALNNVADSQSSSVAVSSKATNNSSVMSVQQLWKTIATRLPAESFSSAEHRSLALEIVELGSLSTRILNALRSSSGSTSGDDSSARSASVKAPRIADSRPDSLLNVYRGLCSALHEGRLFGA